MDAPLPPPPPPGAPLPPAPMDAALPAPAPLAAPLPPPPLPEPAPPVVDVSVVAPLDAPLPPPAPVDAPPAELSMVAAGNWDAAQGPAPAGQPQLWSLPADVPLQPAPGAPVLPPPAPAPAVVAAPAPADPLAPLAGVAVPGEAYDVANQAISGELPLPEGMPHLVSPQNLPPGTTVDPALVPNESPNVTYLKEIWHAIQTQEITGSDALLALTQRPLSTPDPGGVPPHTPLPAGAAPVAPAPAPAPAPVLPPA